MSKPVYPGEIFPNTQDFDEGIRTLLPRYTEMLDSIVRCVPADCATIIDLGCGTGELSLRLLKRCPQAQVLAIDYSPRMLEFAQQKIIQAGDNNRWEPICADFGDLASRHEGDVAIEGAQACVSSLAIHHLSDEMKQTLFNWVFRILEPGDVFGMLTPWFPKLLTSERFISLCVRNGPRNKGRRSPPPALKWVRVFPKAIQHKTA